jgi:hypothetical protein
MHIFLSHLNVSGLGLVHAMHFEKLRLLFFWYFIHAKENNHIQAVLGGKDKCAFSYGTFLKMFTLFLCIYQSEIGDYTQLQRSCRNVIYKNANVVLIVTSSE